MFNKEYEGKFLFRGRYLKYFVPSSIWSGLFIDFSLTLSARGLSGYDKWRSFNGWFQLFVLHVHISPTYMYFIHWIWSHALNIFTCPLIMVSIDIKYNGNSSHLWLWVLILDKYSHLFSRAHVFLILNHVLIEGHESFVISLNLVIVN